MNSQTAPDYVSRVELLGTIAHKFRTKNRILIALAVSVGSDPCDFPSIYWYDDMVDMIDRDFKVGDRVEITGCLRTSRAFPKPIVVGETITAAVKWFDAKFDPSAEYKPDHNEAILKGEFVRAYLPNPDLALITLRMVINGYTYFPQVTCFKKNAARAAEIYEGDIVSIVARIQTQKRVTDKGIESYQTVVCRSMRVE